MGGVTLTEKYKMKKKHQIWVALGMLALLIRWLASPQVIEYAYSRGIFLVVRWIIDYLLASWVPFCLIYLFFAAILYWGYRKWKMTSFRTLTAKDWLLGGASRVLALLGALIFFFLFLMGL